MPNNTAWVDALGSNLACHRLACLEFRGAGIVYAGPPYLGRGRLRRKAFARCSVFICRKRHGIQALLFSVFRAPRAPIRRDREEPSLPGRCCWGLGWAFLGATVAPLILAGTIEDDFLLGVDCSGFCWGITVLCWVRIRGVRSYHLGCPSSPARSTVPPFRLFPPCLTSIVVAGRIHLEH